MATNNSNLFTSLFAQFNDVEVLRSYANEILNQIKDAFNERALEISKGAKADAPTAKAEPKPAKGKAKTAEKPSKTVEAPKAKDESDDALVSVDDKNAIKKLGLKFEKYNEKCWVLRGDTKPLRKVLKEQFKDVYNSRLTGGEGWVFRTANAQECAAALGLKVKVA